MSLRTKALLPLALFGGLLAAYLYGSWMPRSLETIRAEHWRSSERHVDSVVEGLIPLLLARQLDAVYENLDALRGKNRDWVGIELHDAQGRSLYPLNGVSAPTTGTPQGEVHVLERSIEHLGIDLGVLSVSVDFAPWLTQMEHRQRELVAVVLVVILAFFLSAGLAINRFVVKPVNALSHASSELAQGRFEAALERSGDDEVGDLVDRFVEMRDALRGYQVELERRVAERTAQLEAANKELEAFAYSVSHDLRAPLRHLDAFVSLLKKKNTALDEQSRHYMDTISDAARRMATLIDDLLAFSRMGRAEMSRTQVDLGALLHEVVQECEPEAKGRDVQWCLGELPSVTGDRALLRVVLVNLVSNALKFTGPRQHATIEIGCVPGRAENVVFVRDNGVGFDMQYVNKLFGVFQRLHGVAEFEGTGIGLASVRRIVQRHGGSTWAEGRVDGGATFYFSLPRVPEERPAPEPAPTGSR
jgi:signal transduction histidine kinase